MTMCAVSSCSNHSKKTKGTGIIYHRFPREESLLKIWMAKCKRKDSFIANNTSICSIHFTSDNYVRDLQSELLGLKSRMKGRLKPDAVPCVNLSGSENNNPPQNLTSSVSDRAKRNHIRKIRNKIKSSSAECASISNDLDISKNNDESREVNLSWSENKNPPQNLDLSVSDGVKRIHIHKIQSLSEKCASISNDLNKPNDEFHEVNLSQSENNNQPRNLDLSISDADRRIHIHTIRSSSAECASISNDLDMSKNNDESHEVDLNKEVQCTLFNGPRLSKRILELEVENENLRNRNQELKRNNTILRKKTDDLKEEIKTTNKMFRKELNLEMENRLKTIFTKNQIRCLFNNTYVKWNSEDISKASNLRTAVSKKCYIYLRGQMGLPLPSLSTLKRWKARSISCK